MRVVLDSNIFVSALVKPGGRGEDALLKVIEGTDQLIISKPIVLETLRVMAEKFSRDREEIARVAVFLAELGDVVETKQRLKVLEDDPDNRVLECAVIGDADCIVTSDRKMLALGQYEGIRIVSLRQYLAER